MTKNRLRAFSCFGDLPKELRDHVWELAIQNDNDEPEIHFFSASSEEETWENDPERHRTDMWWTPAYSFARPPMWKSRRAWHKIWASSKNPSGYLLDSGLWFACVESRDAVARRREYYDDPYEDVVTIRMPAGNKNSWQRCIAVRPLQDLFVFQLHNITSLPSNIFDLLAERTNLWNFLSLRNVGIEYDPQWARCIQEVDFYRESKVDLSDGTQSVIDLLWALINVAKTPHAYEDMWLIDHHILKPAPGVGYAALVEDRSVFKAKGRKYIEVRRRDVGCTWVVAQGFEEWQTPWSFADEVDCNPGYNNQIDLRVEGVKKPVRWNVASYVEDV